MSGIVCLLNLDGAPADRRVLASMTAYLTHRGPDAQVTWIDGPVGLGHALLRTTWESASERQPLSLDGLTWMSADCRVDARDDLIRELAARGSAPERNAPDPELLLRAYMVWGDACVDHLLGDFSFVIWDGRRRAMFCARDHFGLKPFFYVHAGKTLVVSNDLNCLRVHPGVAHDLDEVAIADFLVSGHALDLDRTSFAAIRRLPPAHTLTASCGQINVRRYWRMPIEDEIRYRRRGEYVEHFRELLDAAVRDRLRTNSVSIFMSGGLDSTAVAATARRVLAESGRPFDLRAHTIVFDRIVPDEERRYSQMAADAIGIPIHHYPLDDDGFPPADPEPDWYPPEPKELFSRGRTIVAYRGPAARARVVLRADGADTLIDGGSVVKDLFAARRYGRLLKEFIWLTWARRQMPRIGLRSQLLHLGRRQPAPPRGFPPFPDWLAPELERRIDLRARWQARHDAPPARPRLELADPYWPAFLEETDPGSMRLAAETRYPFFDVRLARFLLRLPAIPWGTEKSLLRIAAKGALPQPILRRPKTPTAGNPWAALLPSAETAWWEPFLVPAPGLDAFVSVEAARTTVQRVVREVQAKGAPRDIDGLWSALQPISLNLWLRQIACANVPSDPASLGMVTQWP